MFVYNFKEWKLPDISRLKTNIDTELLMLDNQINNTNENEEQVYKCFINLSAQKYFNFENASLLSDFNNSFSLISEMSDELNFLKSKLQPIKKLVSETDFENDFDQNKFLVDLQNLLEDYYNYKYTIQHYIFDEQTKLYSLTNSLVKNDENVKNYDIKKEEIKVLPKIQEAKPNNKKVTVTPDVTKIDKKVENKNSNKANIDNNVKKEENKKTIVNNATEETKNENNIEKPLKPKKELEQNEQIKKALFGDENVNLNKNNFNNNDTNLEDNHLLLISEKENKVYLPYFATDLQQNLLMSDYETYEELIENDYVFPLQKYKSPIISRFKEGFKLMHDKEHESFRTSLKFGLKLMKNYKLHPAVITACRNVEELNSFLDCLDQNTLSTFDIFDIKFDIVPTVK